MIGLRSGRAKGGARLCFAAFAFALTAGAEGYGQTPPGGGQVWTPRSSIEEPGDVGVRAHTNIQIFTPNRHPDGKQTLSGRAGAGVPQVPGAARSEGAVRPQ